MRGTRYLDSQRTKPNVTKSRKVGQAFFSRVFSRSPTVNGGLRGAISVRRVVQTSRPNLASPSTPVCTLVNPVFALEGPLTGAAFQRLLGMKPVRSALRGHRSGRIAHDQFRLKHDATAGPLLPAADTL